MSITNAVYKKKFTASLFEKNSSLAQLINAHNKFIELYAPGLKSEDGIILAIKQDNLSNSFYQDLDIQKVLKHCAELQKNLDELSQSFKKQQEFGRFKDSYWANMETTFNSILAALGVGSIMAGLTLGGIFLAGATAFSALFITPIVFLGVWIILLATSLIIAAVHQYQAGQEYTKQYPQLSASKENPNSFFERKKKEVEQDIEAIAVPVSFESFQSTRGCN